MILALWLYLFVGLALIVAVIFSDRSCRNDLKDAIYLAGAMSFVVLAWPYALAVKIHRDRWRRELAVKYLTNSQNRSYYRLAWGRYQFRSEGEYLAMVDKWWDAEDLRG